MFKTKKRHALELLILISVFYISPLFSQESQTPPSEIQKLYSFEGKWTGSYEVNMDGNKMNANASYTWSKIIDGWGMFIDEKIEIPGMPVYLGHNIIGYDIGGKKYHLYTVSNYAQVHDHAGDWQDDKTLYLEYNGIVDGKPFKEKLNLVLISTNECSMEATEITDGKVSGTYKGNFKKN